MPEPRFGVPRDLIHRAWLLEQVRRALDDDQFRHGPEPVLGRRVHVDHLGIQTANDQQHRCGYMLQRITREVGTPAA